MRGGNDVRFCINSGSMPIRHRPLFNEFLISEHYFHGRRICDTKVRLSCINFILSFAVGSYKIVKKSPAACKSLMFSEFPFVITYLDKSTQ